MQTPGYRLRIFLSVDLAGSTAFKNGHGSRSEEDNDPFPIWVSSIRRFYREFPLLVSQHFRECIVEQCKAENFGPCPALWKTIGDELLFCSRVRSHEHLACCVQAFLNALNAYGRILDQEGRHMDVKGAGWIAAFPAPNVTVTLKELPSVEYLAEELESRADEEPEKFDFLGRDIDSGFRVARHASSDRFVSSVELAWLLSEAHRSKLIVGAFAYHGRHILKGVLKDRPYPVISLDTERSQSRRDVRVYEQLLSKVDSIEPTNIRNFCEAFMKDESIEFPVLGRHGDFISDSRLPESYKNFQKAAAITLEETTRRDKAEQEAADAPADNGLDLPSEVTSQADQQVKNSTDGENDT